MGMDVYGKNPVNETGKYFRNNCWRWRPLWVYCEQIAPELTSKVEYGQSNDGDGLKTQEDCDKFAQLLEDAVKNRIEYIEPEDLSRIDKQGKMYPFSYDNVLNFCRFLRQCGGFEIW